MEPIIPDGLSKYKISRVKKPEHTQEFINRLKELTDKDLVDIRVKDFLTKHLALLKTKSNSPEALQSYSTFLPPRLVKACKDGALVPFFGSGISLASGIPTWKGLLEILQINSDFLSDPHLENDPLTQAELIAHEIGRDDLQQKLRELIKIARIPTLAHYLLARLSLPVYMTTNYDTLFEKAWKTMRNNTDLVTITNDADIANYRLTNISEFPIKDKTVLIKVHGCADRDNEHLILTRSDYRHHYRSNQEFFKVVKDILKSGYVLFLGFGHRDPEISRLVDDIVYDYESTLASGNHRPPTLYSVQFDMRQKTPEVFAARGIVALRPANIVSNLNTSEIPAASLAVGLGEIYTAMDDNAHEKIELDELLREFANTLSMALNKAMTVLKDRAPSILSSLKSKDKDSLKGHLNALVSELETLASQGVYVTSENGDIIEVAVPQEKLNADKRLKELQELEGGLSERPYFRRAKTFRSSFVSDLYESLFNEHSTFFLCVPLGNSQHFDGLVFAVAQPGAWSLPIELKNKCPDKVEFILVDSNGIAVIPALPFLPTEYEFKPGNPTKLPPGETKEANQGFPYKLIHELSRRDMHISHIVQNVVPVGWDDDVHDVTSDLRLYSKVAYIQNTRWKLALSRPVPSTVRKEKDDL